jgi:hypothetical protein
LLDEDVLNILPDGQQFKIISESGTELTCRFETGNRGPVKRFKM